MKASERLKELDGGMEPAPWGPKYWNEPDRVGLSALRNALPLIADVVEAAEHQVGDTRDWAELHNFGMDAEKLNAALTALRDALQDGSSPPHPEGATAP